MTQELIRLRTSADLDFVLFSKVSKLLKWSKSKILLLLPLFLNWLWYFLLGALRLVVAWMYYDLWEEVTFYIHVEEGWMSCSEYIMVLIFVLFSKVSKLLKWFKSKILLSLPLFLNWLWYFLLGALRLVVAWMYYDLWEEVTFYIHVEEGWMSCSEYIMILIDEAPTRPAPISDASIPAAPVTNTLNFILPGEKDFFFYAPLTYGSPLPLCFAGYFVDHLEMVTKAYIYLYWGVCIVIGTIILVDTVEKAQDMQSPFIDGLLQLFCLFFIYLIVMSCL